MGLFSSKHCACTKSTSLGGRILSSNPPSASGYGQMARKFSRKYLVCFGCSKKSGIKYDGLITSWECARCTSINYLDENGDITDPPVATNDVSPGDIKHSFSRADSPSSEAFSRSSKSSPFCAACLKNQHLYIASLQQFHVELDPHHPEYRESERKYYKFRKNLDELYPQVCEDCLPNVQQGLENAHKTTKADIIRTSLARSKLRARKAVRGITVAGLRDFSGRLLWYLGLLCQLLWHFIVLSAIADQHLKMTPDVTLPAFNLKILSTMLKISHYFPTGSRLGGQGLMCSLASCWWNPKFNNLNVGFTTHITGYSYWYKHQLISLVIRALFYLVMAHEDFAETSYTAIGAAHIFILVFITFLAIRAHTFIKVDYARLWSNDPTKLPFVGPGSSPKQKSGESMADAINELRSGSRINRPAPIPVTPYNNYKPEPYIPGTITGTIDGHQPPSLSSLKALNVPLDRGRISPPMFNYPSVQRTQFQPPQPTIYSQPPQISLDEQYAGMNLECMDWTPEPALPKSQHRAFSENLPVDSDAVFLGRATPQNNTKLFGQSPVVPEPSAFWYKVPPAPITPAHRLRNPPNQPRMRVISQEQKQNFFKNSQNSPPLQDSISSGNEVSQRNDIQFAQQKFFAPEVPSDGHEVLVSAFGGWSLGDSDISQLVPRNGDTRTRQLRHVGQAIALSVALIYWNRTLDDRSEQTKNITLAILVGCFCIGLRTILDHTVFKKDDTKGVKNASASICGSCVGGFECVAALYGISQIWRGAERNSCGPFVTILTGGMLVHELWELMV